MRPEAATDVDVPLCPRCGRRPDLEDAQLVEFDDGVVRPFCGDVCRKWVECHDGLVPLDLGPWGDAMHEADRQRTRWVGPT